MFVVPQIHNSSVKGIKKKKTQCKEKTREKEEERQKEKNKKGFDECLIGITNPERIISPLPF